MRSKGQGQLSASLACHSGDGCLVYPPVRQLGFSEVVVGAVWHSVCEVFTLALEKAGFTCFLSHFGQVPGIEMCPINTYF